MRRFLRYLRIGWTIAWGAIAVLLVVLWMRSYEYDLVMRRHGKQVNYVNSHSKLITVWSKQGAVHFCVAEPQMSGTEWSPAFARGRVLGFGAMMTATALTLRIPYWFPTTLSAGLLAVSPWLRWRFSLRTLLIATTLVAVGLGTIMALSR